MKERINWIDWSKFMAITLVVIGHLPMEPGNPVHVYINCFHMPFFMFLSGYLTKRSDSFTKNLKKDWTGIILPFLLYNAVLYPYAMAKSYTVGVPISFTNYVLNPFLGVTTLSLFHGLINGPTWFLVALFFSRIVLDFSNRLKYKYTFLVIISTLFFIFYEVNEYYVFTEKLVLIGFARCLPYFLLGKLLQGKIVASKCQYRLLLSATIVTGVASIGASLFLYDISIFFIRIQVLQLICICAIIFFTCISLLFNSIKLIFVVNISIGTLVIFGLHWACIGCFNQLFQCIFGIDQIKYEMWQVLLLAVLIEVILYPLIKSLPPMWLGKRKEIVAQIRYKRKP